MAPIVHLVRHAQAQSNVDPKYRDVLDPELTKAGVQQARDLSLEFPYFDRIEAVISSPLQRALQTTLLAFGDSCNKIIALPLAQETSHAPCDTGRGIEALKRLLLESKVDYQYVEPGWNSKTGPWSQNDDAVNERAARLRAFLARRPERELVLVTHGFFLRFLTEDWSELEKSADWCGFGHCEYRSYTLEPVEGGHKLREITTSLLRRST